VEGTEVTEESKFKKYFLVVLHINLSDTTRWFRVISTRGGGKNYRTSSPQCSTRI